MARKTQRKFFHYTLQAHEPHGGYERIFSALRQVPATARLAAVGLQEFFVADVTRHDFGYLLRVCSIKPETDYTTFDVGDFALSDTSLPANKRFAVAAHGFLVSGTRRFIYEYVRGGPKVDDTIHAIELILRANNPEFRRFRLTATPVVGPGFMAEVERLERIRVVRIDVTQPNASWDDWDDALHELGEESEADHISLQAVAPRAESLSKRRGIVQVLRQALSAPNSHVDKAVIEGRFPDEAADRTIRTDKHQEFDTRRVDVDSGGSTNLVSASAAFQSIAEMHQEDND